jgi:valyl-tRNA synthetase
LPRGAAAASETRVEKALADVDDEIAQLSAKLANAAYLAKAPASVVEKTRVRLRELEARRAALGQP